MSESLGWSDVSIPLAIQKNAVAAKQTTTDAAQNAAYENNINQS